MYTDLFILPAKKKLYKGAEKLHKHRCLHVKFYWIWGEKNAANQMLTSSHPQRLNPDWHQWEILKHMQYNFHHHHKNKHGGSFGRMVAYYPKHQNCYDFQFATYLLATWVYSPGDPAVQKKKKKNQAALSSLIQCCLVPWLPQVMKKNIIT